MKANTILLIVVLGVLVSTGPAMAVTYTSWYGDEGDYWDQEDPWTPTVTDPGTTCYSVGELGPGPIIRDNEVAWCVSIGDGFTVTLESGSLHIEHGEPAFFIRGEFNHEAGTVTASSAATDVEVFGGLYWMYDDAVSLTAGELWVHDNETDDGTFDQEVGLVDVDTLTVDGAIYVLDGGTLRADELIVGDDGIDTNGNGKFDIQDNTADIQVGNKVTFGPDAEFEATTGSQMTITLGEDDSTAPETGEFEVSFVDDNTHSAADVDGLGDLTLKCGFAETVVDSDTKVVSNELLLEACGEHQNLGQVDGSDFSAANFVIDELAVGCDPNEIDPEAGKITVKLIDAFDNQDDGAGEKESVFVNTLDMRAGAVIDLNGVYLYYLNGDTPKRLIPGDCNLDGAVSLADLGAVATHYGETSGGTWAKGDFNGDRRVSLADLGVVATNYGGTGKTGSGIEITVSEDSTATPGLSGYVTIEVTLSTGDEGSIITAFELDFDADTMNQINPYSIPTIFEDCNGLMSGTEIEQDSQFEFHTSNDDLMVQSSSESGTNLTAEFALTGGANNENASHSVLVAHIVLPEGVEATLEGAVIVRNSGNVLLGGGAIPVSVTINEQE